MWRLNFYSQSQINANVFWLYWIIFPHQVALAWNPCSASNRIELPVSKGQCFPSLIIAVDYSEQKVVWKACYKELYEKQSLQGSIQLIPECRVAWCWVGSWQTAQMNGRLSSDVTLEQAVSTISFLSSHNRTDTRKIKANYRSKRNAITRFKSIIKLGNCLWSFYLFPRSSVTSYLASIKSRESETVKNDTHHLGTFSYSSKDIAWAA